MTEDALNTQVAQLRGKFSPAAQKRISDFLGSFKTFEATLGLLYGDIAGVVAGKPSWSITALDPTTVQDTIDMYASFGAVVAYELDGFRVIVPQIACVAELDQGELDFIDNRICAVSPAA